MAGACARQIRNLRCMRQQEQHAAGSPRPGAPARNAVEHVIAEGEAGLLGQLLGAAGGQRHGELQGRAQGGMAAAAASGGWVAAAAGGRSGGTVCCAERRTAAMSTVQLYTCSFNTHTVSLAEPRSRQAGTQRWAHQGYQLIGVRQHLLELAHRNLAPQFERAGAGCRGAGTAISKLVQLLRAIRRWIQASRSMQCLVGMMEGPVPIDCPPGGTKRRYKSSSHVVFPFARSTYLHMQGGCTFTGCSLKQGVGCLASSTHFVAAQTKLGRFSAPAAHEEGRGPVHRTDGELGRSLLQAVNVLYRRWWAEACGRQRPKPATKPRACCPVMIAGLHV